MSAHVEPWTASPPRAGNAVEGLSPAIDRVTLLEIGSEHRLLDLAQICWHQRRRLLRMAMVLSLLAFITGLLIPNSYRSTTRLMPPDKQSRSNLAVLAGRVAGAESGLMPDDLLGI